ncbi:chemotaxis protein CheW [Paucisalibacillus globulus]|uniref:chemotaxis protein CheW n=1 Tax=Paucisalibacillus globulus TaxID=351095 RepID=UPI000BB9BA40|nr:chemotaxis protein CheW [Paucisalibacillus globulus]
MENLLKVIVITLNNQRYGINVQQILSIEKMQEITRVPRTSEFIKGVINLRGETIPVIDLKERLQLETSEPTNQSRILVIQVDAVTVGLIVDSATDVLDIDTNEIERASEMAGIVNEKYIAGIAKRAEELLLLLNLQTILNFEETEEVIQLEKVEEE